MKALIKMHVAWSSWQIASNENEGRLTKDKNYTILWKHDMKYLFAHGILYENSVTKHSSNDSTGSCFYIKEANVLY